MTLKIARRCTELGYGIYGHAYSTQKNWLLETGVCKKHVSEA